MQAQDRNLSIFRALDENDGKRPDLLMEREGVNGRDLYLDVTVSHPTCQSYVQYAGRERGHTIKKKVKEKNDKYKERCERQGSCFMPLAFESFGLASKEVVNLISSLSEKASELSGLPFAFVLSYWKKRISTTLQVGTAKCIMDVSSSTRNHKRQNEIEDSVLLESYHVRARH